jgi:hypothetical protein
MSPRAHAQLTLFSYARRSIRVLEKHLDLENRGASRHTCLLPTPRGLGKGVPVDQQVQWAGRGPPDDSLYSGPCTQNDLVLLGSTL